MQKNTIIILVVCIALILIGAYLLYQPVQAPADASPAAVAQEVPFSVLTSGNFLESTTTRKNVRLTSSDQLAAAWVAAYGKKSAAPSVDFSQNEVYAVYDGAHPTGGYTVSVDKITDDNGMRIVSILHVAPDPSCVVTQAFTSPFEFVTVPASSATLTHVDETATVSCK